MLNSLHRGLLYVLCRHCIHWPGMWRLDLVQRVKDYRFPTDGTMVVPTKWGLPIEVRRQDFLGRVLYFFGDFERKLLDAAEREIRPADTVLDLGANIGTVTLFLGKLVGKPGRIFCVEPLAANFAMLERNVNRAGFLDRVYVERCALGTEEKTVTLHFDEKSDNWGEVSLLDQASHGTEEVPMRRLDSLWKEWQRPQFDFVKLDVEGYEYEVLLGATEMLRDKPPKVWVVEFNIDYLNRAENGVQRLWDLFRQYGYEAFRMEKDERLLEPPKAHCDILFRLGGREGRRMKAEG